MEALLENLKSKIDELRDAKRSKDPIKFSNIVKDIQTIISELGQPLGIEVPGLRKLNTKQILTDSSHPDTSNRDQQKIVSLFRRIEDLFLSYRATKCLKSQHIVYIGDLVQKSESELLRIPNFGRKSLRELSRELAHIGFRLGTQIRGWRPENLEEWSKLLGQESTQAAETQLEQNYEVRLPTEPVRLSRRDFINLLREVDEFELSVRTAKCLKNLRVIYIGDLVYRKESELLRTRNFGRKSLFEIKKILNQMNLDLGMSILGWPPDNIEKAMRFFSSELEQIRMQGVINGQRNLRPKFDYLEDELFHLASLMGDHRYAQIVTKHLGWDGQMPRTLDAVGRDFNITRERVRQICLKFERKVRWKGRNRALHLPILDSTLQFVAEHLPTHCSYIESELANRGISRGIVRPEGLLRAAEILDRTPPFSIVMLGRKRFVVEPEAVKEPKLILQLARKSIEHWGVATFIDIAAQVAEKTNRPASQNFTKTVLSSSKDFHLLDECGGWFWLSSVPRNRLINAILKILSVAGQIDIPELRAGIGRHRRMEGFAPPRRVLLEFCRQLPWCQVESNIVTADPPVNWEEILAGSTEWAMAAILKEHGPVMSRVKFEEMCLGLGMNENTFFQYLTYSPIITKYAFGVYGLRGATIQPGIVESLKTKREPKKVLVDFGWTSDGKIWLGHQISRGMFESGVFSVPAAMQKFLQGDFTFKVADGVYLGKLNVKDSSVWSLRPFFERRGGEPGDYLVITFDLSTRQAKAFVGDKDLLDDFQPENRDSESTKERLVEKEVTTQQEKEGREISGKPEEKAKSSSKEIMRIYPSGPVDPLRRTLFNLLPEHEWKCGRCGRNRQILIGSFGPYLKCSNRKCGKAKKIAPAIMMEAFDILQIPCAECLSPMVVTIGCDGWPSARCSQFPKCNAVESWIELNKRIKQKDIRRQLGGKM